MNGEVSNDTILDSMLGPFTALGTIGVVVTITLVFNAVGWTSFLGDSSPEAVSNLKRATHIMLCSFYLFAFGTAPIIAIAFVYTFPYIKNVIIHRRNVRMGIIKGDSVHFLEHIVVSLLMALTIVSICFQLAGIWFGLASVHVLFPWTPLLWAFLYYMIMTGVCFGILWISAFLDRRDIKNPWKRFFISMILGAPKQDEVNDIGNDSGD